MDVTILTEAETRACATLHPQSLQAIEDAFRKLAEGSVTQPPVMRVDIPENNGEVDVKTAYIRGHEGFAIKVSSGFFDNERLGLPSLSGMMVLFSTQTGIPMAVLLDNGYLTDLRTGLAGAVAAKYLAREEISAVGVIGAGTQARFQVRALRLVREFDRVIVYSRTAAKVEQYAREMGSELGVEVVEAREPATVVQQSNLVVTTTPAREPYLKAEWLHPGLHITALGSDAEEKNELEPQALAQADILVCDSKAQCSHLGELHHALDAGLVTADGGVLELGTLIAEGRSGRTRNEDVTICDLTGTGVQDTAIALLAYRKAVEFGSGRKIDA